MESMVQRVVRQIKETKLTNDITLATNISQLDIITNQLGDSVSVVTEPERRDTFPAIALAVSYLKLAEGRLEKIYEPVSRFIEKPSVEVAEDLLKQNALWNGGVFAFL